MADETTGTDVLGNPLATEWTVWQATAIRDALRDRLATGEPVDLDLGGVSKVDLAGLQLLCSAHRTADAQGKSFRVIRWSDTFVRMIETAGFLRRQGCCTGCLWNRGEDK